MSFQPIAIRTRRDARLLKIGPRKILAISCDSSGAIGPKLKDRLRVRAEVVGRFSARVALMELLSTGASPVCLSCTLGVERHPTGARIMKGVAAELRHAGIRNVSLMDSTENNFQPNQTGIGTTAIGLVDPKDLNVGTSEVGDSVFAVGIPEVGRKVLLAERRKLIANTRDVRKLLRMKSVHEVIPAGSRGIIHEAQTLAIDSKLHFRTRWPAPLDLGKSAGPATVLVCTAPQSMWKQLQFRTRKPVSEVGRLA